MRGEMGGGLLGVMQVLFDAQCTVIFVASGCKRPAKVDPAVAKGGGQGTPAARGGQLLFPNRVVLEVWIRNTICKYRTIGQIMQRRKGTDCPLKADSAR